jgi:hypothetical protein
MVIGIASLVIALISFTAETGAFQPVASRGVKCRVLAALPTPEEASAKAMTGKLKPIDSGWGRSL